MKELAQAYPEAKKIRLLLDNLNTHTPSACYEHLPAQEAFALADRSEFYCTPKSASWLRVNLIRFTMIEIEFSALAKACLNQRIPTKEQFQKQVLALLKEREEKQIKISWQFSIQSARSKLNRHYVQINEHIQRYKQT